MGLFVSTVSGNVTIPELGITLVHPATNFDVGAQFSSAEVSNANALTNAITGGTLTWKKTSGGAVEAAADYDPDWLRIDQEDTGTGAYLDQVATKRYVQSQTGGARQTSRMTSTQSSSSATYADLTQLVSQSLAVGKYTFKASVIIQSASAGNGHGLRFTNGSATVTNFIAATSLAKNPDTAVNFFEQFIQRTLTDNYTTTVSPAANTNYMSYVEGVFEVTVAGTVKMQFRSEANGVAVTAGIGSIFEIQEII